MSTTMICRNVFDTITFSLLCNKATIPITCTTSKLSKRSILGTGTNRISKRQEQQQHQREKYHVNKHTHWTRSFLSQLTNSGSRTSISNLKFAINHLDYRKYTSTSTTWQQQKKVSAISLTSKKRKGTKITMVTAYDYPSAIHVARAGIDIVLVGDSVAMVELGFSTTQPVSMDNMIHHSIAVKRGVDFACNNYSNSNSTSDQQQQTNKYPLLIGDMPFGSYEYIDTDIALRNAYRFVKEGGMDAVKLEVRAPRFNIICRCELYLKSMLFSRVF
jgi:Ketopantoate hydroxymethyltransferase